ETEGLHIGVSIHVDAQRWLRNPNPDLWTPVGDVHSRSWTWIDIKDVACFLRQCLDVVQISPGLDWNSFDWVWNVHQNRWDGEGHNSVDSVAQADQRDPRFGWHAWETHLFFFQVHQQSQVFPGDRQGGLAGLVAGRDALLRN